MKRASQLVLGPFSPVSALIRPTFYRQFVGGDTERELTTTANKLEKSGLRLMVCPAQEEDQGEADPEGDEAKYDHNKEYIMNVGRIMAGTGTREPNLQFKVTAFMSGDLVTRLTELLTSKVQNMDGMVTQMTEEFQNPGSINLQGLKTHENDQLITGLARIKELADLAENSGLKLLVDAEYTYMNPGISAVALTLMCSYNQQRPVVGNTYQCYLKAALETIRAERDLVLSRGSAFAGKVVRGAYMEKERRLAAQHGYEDPVCESYEATGKNYDRVIDEMIQDIAKGVNPKGYFVVASHNEASAAKAAQTAIAARLTATGNIVFGQIYGMGEQISMPLANSGLIVYKSVPYGPLVEVIPYLSRRAAENRVVLAGARKEKQLLSAELKRRAAGGFVFAT